MNIRYPNYYKKFHCIAGACPDTCCAGWEIPVDAASERRYREMRKNGAVNNKTFAKKLKKYIRDGRIISDDITCPFLNGEGLCEMYLELGPDALCHTCSRHPRHMEDYGNLHEIILLLSCPEAARLILEENDGSFYTREVPERQGNMDGIDEELLDFLLRVREQIWTWTADLSMTMDEVLMCSVSLAHDVQRRMSRGEHHELDEVLERYRAEEIAGKFRKQWTKTETDHRWILMLDFFEELAELDVVCRDWPMMQENCLFKLKELAEEQAEITKKKADETDRELRNIFQYYIYSFLLSSLYDKDLLIKVKMAALCTAAMEVLFLTSDNNDPAARANLCHALARQIENSDANRDKLEEGVKTDRFQSRRLIDAWI